ncbi:OmpH family outer membrane protein [Flavobacterium psychrophilum]|nr:OmpH family outer membrane protein [Flavobacterium psychrophilum]AIN74154.1 membrane protein [Flavobacterium psychrophilum FPG3]AKC22474.1 membrane protein [Flavobacterium psychrophilum]EKT2068636.1 OmpH family outer membrane protein [Flavobacterium psychrophilum]EKT2070741.1 OmpH family outer membrane protein [Flavobacterium psychrophilum]EKT3957304.1 OmpH family outer membrane protein [Flavobacterium psychrophilum]
MKQIKTLLIAAVIFFGASTMNAQTKVAHIDVSELLAKMPEMTAAKAQLDKLSKTFDTEYGTMVTEYQTKMKKYEAEATTATEAINETRAKEMQDMGQRIQQYRDSAQKQLQEKEQEIVKPIMDKAKTAIVKVGKSKGYQYVMDSASLILADGPNLFEDVKKELKF